MAATVGTWNVENLFRPGGDGPSSQEAYRAKLAALQETITAMDPDALAVQEIGDPKALDDLVDGLDGDWHHALADPDGRGIRVGVLARRRLTQVDQIAELPDRLGPVRVGDGGQELTAMGRPGLRARVTVEGTAIDVISCHLKSKLLSFPGGRFTPKDEGERARYAVYALHRRAAEAAAVRSYVADLLAGDGEERAVIVAGDLNDTLQAATTQLLHGPPGSEIGTDGFDRSDQGDQQRMWNLAHLIRTEDRWSRIYRGRRELIDHLLVSHALVKAVDSVRTIDIDTRSVGDHPRERHDDPVSDHRPVLARIQLAK